MTTPDPDPIPPDPDRIAQLLTDAAQSLKTFAALAVEAENLLFDYCLLTSQLPPNIEAIYQIRDQMHADTNELYKTLPNFNTLTLTQ